MATSSRSLSRADPATWSGRSIAFVNQATTAGFLYPLSRIREAGITEDPADFFSRAIFSGSHDASIQAVAQGEVEMGACKNWIYKEFIAEHPEFAEKLVILSESPQVPSNGLGVRPTLKDELKKVVVKGFGKTSRFDRLIGLGPTSLLGGRGQ